MNAAYIKPLFYMCNKILPLVYDESLSYYEALCKMRSKLNEVIDNVNNIPDYIDDVINEKLTDEHILELLSRFVVNIEAAISSNNEGTNTNASKPYTKGEMLWLNDILYRAMVDIPAGTTFIVDTNIETVTFEDLYNDFIEEVKHDICPNDDGTNTTASVARTAGDWLWLEDELYIVTRDIARGNAYLKTGDNSNLRKIDIAERVDVVYYPNDKRLTLHARISDYEQIVTAGDYHVYSPTREAIEIVRID